MRRSLLLIFLFLPLAALNCVEDARGQNFRGSQTQTEAETQPADGKTARAATTAPAKAEANQPKPWLISSRIHLEKGSTQGYIVVQLDLSEGYHVYSLNPQGSLSPTRLAVIPSNDLRVKSKFVSDKPPLVIEKDPVFDRRIEKHKGQVRFFAPIEVRAGVDPTQLMQEVQFSGQVCSADGCQPIRDLISNASFAGYFEAPKTGSTESASQDQLR